MTAQILKFAAVHPAPANDDDIASPMAGIRHWYSAQELADLKLPGMPKGKNGKRRVNDLARAEHWATRVNVDGQPLARARAGRGGGAEYHLDLLPPTARAKLIAIAGQEAKADGRAPQANDSDADLWRAFDQHPQSVKDEARRRMDVLTALVQLERGGLTRTAAIATVCAQHDVKRATIWTWLDLVRGVPVQNHLPYLARRHGGGGRAVEVDAHLWKLLISDYLRKSKPSFASCCWRVRRVATEKGLTLAPDKTLWRKFTREIDPLVISRERDGAEKLALMKPAQMRSVEDMHAMEMINIDGHRWDVFVEWPGLLEPVRPMMICMSDIYSRKPLAWRFDLSENSHVTRLAFRDVFERYGIPKACLMDNGRAFNSKQFTGGNDKRNRFKIKDEEPTGVLTALGIEIVLATPYHGQAKPIERSFREMCDKIARHPAFQGAYTGSNPMAKPDDYKSRAIPYDQFVAVVNAEIIALCDKAGRRNESANGRSWNTTFDESYAQSAIGKATPEQLRLALLSSSELIGTHRKDGSVRLYGNSYWHIELSRRAGDKVRVRFDPENLHSSIEVYDAQDRHICTAELETAKGFRDVEAAKSLAKANADFRKKAKAASDSLELLHHRKLAIELAAFETPADALPDPGAVRPVRSRRGSQASLNPVLDAAETAPTARKSLALDRLADARAKLKLVD